MSYTFNNHFSANKAIMEKVGQIASDKLRVPSPEERILRAKLIVEEALETVEALGVDYIMGRFIDAGEDQYDPKGVLDGVCDIAVVSNGTLLCCGLHTVFEDALNRVDVNNWSKVKDGVIRNADGKYQKPPGYVPVVLDDLIESVS